MTGEQMEHLATREQLADLRAEFHKELITLQAAGKLSDLATPPGNRLEPLTGRRKGFHSIRINDQWRIVFRWTDKGPANVAIVDYH